MLDSVSVYEPEPTRMRKRRKYLLAVLAFLVLMLAVMLLGLPKRAALGKTEHVSVQGVVNSAVGPLWQRVINAARGPVRVGIQIGHENVAAHPEELAHLRWNTGGHANGVDEVDLNHEVAEAVRAQLEAYGIEVDLLSAAPPEGYYADLVLSLHADSVPDPARRGYKSAHFEPERNPLEPRLKRLIDEAYLAGSSFPNDDLNTTENMNRYYAFNLWRYRHSIHPGTPSLIVEMGYLSSASDMAFLDEPEEPAAALSAGIVEFLRERGRLSATHLRAVSR